MAGSSGLAIYSIRQPMENGGHPSKKNKRKNKHSKSSAVSSFTVEHTTTVARFPIPGVSEEDAVQYRAARFHPEQPDILFAVANINPSRRAKRQGARRSVLVKFDTNSWLPIQVKPLNEKGSVTSFDITYIFPLVFHCRFNLILGRMGDSSLLGHIAALLAC